MLRPFCLLWLFVRSWSPARLLRRAPQSDDNVLITGASSQNLQSSVSLLAKTMRTFRFLIFSGLALAMVGVVSYRTAGAVPQSSSTAKKKKTKKHSAKRDQGQKAPTPERISEIQAALAKGGYYQGDPNGKWDPDTVAALQKFQSSHGIDASGKLDAATLRNSV